MKISVILFIVKFYARNNIFQHGFGNFYFHLNISHWNFFVEIKSHLIGDVYVEDDDLTQNLPYDIQNAPLKKWEDKRWPNGVVPYVLTDTGFSK